MIQRILKTEPVRLYSIAMAVVALAAYFVPTNAWPLVLALVASVLGLGHATRSTVTPLVDPKDQAGRSLVPSLPGVPDQSTPDRGAVDLATVNAICLVILAAIAVLWAFGEAPF